jgi:uncharacterized membrane protein YbaN (DUF454 family)
MTTKPSSPVGRDSGDVRPSPSAPVRYAWQSVAIVCVGLGGAGAVLPLVPTTPFLLLAAWAASRSSPRLHEWLYSHPRYGPLLRDWRDHRAIRPRAKRIALVLIAISWLIMLATVPGTVPRVLATLVMAAVTVFLATRPTGPNHD